MSNNNFHTWDEFDDEIQIMDREQITLMSQRYYQDCGLDNKLADERAQHDFRWFYCNEDGWTSKTLNFLDENDIVNIFYNLPKDIGLKVISFL